MAGAQCAVRVVSNRWDKNTRLQAVHHRNSVLRWVRPDSVAEGEGIGLAVLAGGFYIDLLALVLAPLWRTGREAQWTQNTLFVVAKVLKTKDPNT